MRSPIYDPIRHEPRFLEMQEQYDRKIAVQRETIDALVKAGGVAGVR